MQALKRRRPYEFAVEAHWWSVVYRDKDGNTCVLGTINSKNGAVDWAARMNDTTKLNRHYWAEPAKAGTPGVKS